MAVSEKIRKVSTITFNILLLSVQSFFVHEYSIINTRIEAFSEVLVSMEFDSQIVEKINFVSVIELEPI